MIDSAPLRIPIAQAGAPGAVAPAAVPRHRRHPDWLKVKLPGGPSYERLRSTLHGLDLHTVCEEALCPNVAECWGAGTATFMILGDICTRGCRYCAVDKGHPTELDLEEPSRVAEAVTRMDLRHVVVTSVDRDDLADGGAEIFAETIRSIRARMPECAVEVLIPDFQGNEASLRAVLAERPDILNHNIETVPRLFPTIRLGGDYARSLELLRRAAAADPDLPTKSGMMLGLGETIPEVLGVMADLRAQGVRILTLGQYLQPSRKHAPVDRYVDPAEFAELKLRGLDMGFAHVESGPLVRSSYH
ncbi:MAG TPA: lipoyl synthase, partial [Candidatus Udaeobacter sp.]|nr:lipoyl synthase [Candidatus Udaeobacter sp.]